VAQRVPSSPTGSAPDAPKADLLDEIEHDALAYMAFSRKHHKKRHGTRLIGAVQIDQNDEWQIANRYMQVEAFAQIKKRGNRPDSQQKNSGRMIMA
jgi:putative transposase